MGPKLAMYVFMGTMVYGYLEPITILNMILVHFGCSFIAVILIVCSCFKAVVIFHVLIALVFVAVLFTAIFSFLVFVVVVYLLGDA